MSRYEVWDHGVMIGSYDNRNDAYHAYNLAVNRSERNGNRGTVELLDTDPIGLDFEVASHHTI